MCHLRAGAPSRRWGDAVAMGILRQYLVDNFGLTAARAVFTQFGFAHGWRMADAGARLVIAVILDNWAITS